MFSSLPKSALEVMDQGWSYFEPYFHDLESRPLTARNVSGWLADWTRVTELVEESYWRLYVATTVDTENKEVQQHFETFVEHVRPASQEAEQKLKRKLLESGLGPEGFGVPLRKMRTQAALFREANLPLLVEEQKSGREYERIVGAQTVEWEGKEITLQQLSLVYLEADRQKREQAWRLGLARQLADREAINAVWVRMMGNRRQIAANAYLPDFRAYRWQDMLRFAYTPEDCATFRQAIEEVVVPAAVRIHEKRRKRLGLDRLRPWDLFVDPFGQPPLKPFKTAEELVSKTAAIFQRVDPVLGGYFETMRQENLLDVANRPGKAPGAYSTPFEATKKPFIFMNAVGVHDDVMTLIHEGGHAFHAMECAHLPYYQQRGMTFFPSEFAEVASMAMELLASPYLPASEGGFYTPEELARARIEHLESILTFLPYMAAIDGYQHWVYTHPQAAADPARCDAVWSELWGRFMQGVDWSGLEDGVTARWRRQIHLFTDPFYYVEYGLAQLGAIQVWRNALDDQAAAVAQYRHALSLGASVTVPELFAAAGGKFAFDAPMMQMAVGLIEKTIAEQEALL